MAIGKWDLTRNKYFLFLVVVLLVNFCDNQKQTSRFAQYLGEERGLRERIAAEQMLEDSLKALKQKYKVKYHVELSRLHNRPTEWIVLLRKLRHG